MRTRCHRDSGERRIYSDRGESEAKVGMELLLCLNDE